MNKTLVVLLLGCCSVSEVHARVCSSLNGPSCNFMLDGLLPPSYARLNIDKTIEKRALTDALKSLHLEKVVNSYEEPMHQELHAEELLDSETQQRLLEGMLEAVTEEYQDLLKSDPGEDIAELQGSFGLTNVDGLFDSLESMTADEMREFFTTALEDMTEHFGVYFEDVSPGLTQFIKHTIHQLKHLEDVASFHFQRLNEQHRASIKARFENHGLIEVQAAFERIIMARTPQEKQLAFESLVYLLQLADERNAHESTNKSSHNM